MSENKGLSLYVSYDEFIKVIGLALEGSLAINVKEEQYFLVDGTMPSEFTSKVVVTTDNMMVILDYINGEILDFTVVRGGGEYVN